MLNNLVFIGTHNFKLMILEYNRVDLITYFKIEFNLLPEIEMDDIIHDIQEDTRNQLIFILTNSSVQYIDAKYFIESKQEQYKLNSMLLREKN